MSIPRNWRLQVQRYRLVGEVCKACGMSIFPPRGTCLKCAASYTLALAPLGERSLVPVRLAKADADPIRRRRRW
jgi:uncharacterized OB-fold protein